MDPQTKLQVIMAAVFGTVYLYLIFRSKHMATALWIGVGLMVAASVISVLLVRFWPSS